MINKTTSQKLREVAAKLIKQADELERGIDRSKCVHGEYTNEAFGHCKSCGNPKVVICSNKKTVGKRRNSKGCNAHNCKYFTPSTKPTKSTILKHSEANK